MKERFEATADRKQRAREARCGIANNYHLFDSKTGKPTKSSDVQKRLNGHFQTLHTVADEAKDRSINKWRKLPACDAKNASWKLTPHFR